MKKFLLFALCAISTMSLFAEAFSSTKVKELAGKHDYIGLLKYGYQSSISKQSSYNHMNFYFGYISRSKKLTTEQILKEAEKFKSLSEQNYNIGLGLAYARFGYEKQAMELFSKTKNYTIVNALISYYKKEKQYDKAINLAQSHNLFYNCFNISKSKRDYAKAWEFGVKQLTVHGGYYHNARCVQIIHYIFRYKPASVTKEQQIEFLSKLAQIYPIPGTDFNQWKSFMGFVGYKYKALTGKDLF